MTSKDQWANLHAAFRESGLTKAEFHRTKLRQLLPSDEPLPTLRQMSYWFTHFENAAKNSVIDQPVSDDSLPETDSTEDAGVRTFDLGDEVRIAEVDDDAVDAFMNSFKPAESYCREPRLRKFRMTLPAGTVIEFESPDPDALALRMIMSSEAVR